MVYLSLGAGLEISFKQLSAAQGGEIIEKAPHAHKRLLAVLPVPPVKIRRILPKSYCTDGQFYQENYDDLKGLCRHLTEFILELQQTTGRHLRGNSVDQVQDSLTRQGAESGTPSETLAAGQFQTLFNPTFHLSGP
jgi:hypothetical protein